MTPSHHPLIANEFSLWQFQFSSRTIIRLWPWLGDVTGLGLITTRLRTCGKQRPAEVTQVVCHLVPVHDVCRLTDPSSGQSHGLMIMVLDEHRNCHSKRKFFLGYKALWNFVRNKKIFSSIIKRILWISDSLFWLTCSVNYVTLVCLGCKNKCVANNYMYWFHLFWWLLWQNTTKTS